MASPAYLSALQRQLRDPSGAHLLYTPEEVSAVQGVDQAVQRTAMTTGSTGVGLPFDLDPSIILTGDGSVNPVRQLASVVTIGAHKWVGASSAGVTASYDQEATEVSDDTPSLVQPTVTPQTGRAFVQASIEALQGLDRRRVRDDPPTR